MNWCEEKAQKLHLIRSKNGLIFFLRRYIQENCFSTGLKLNLFIVDPPFAFAKDQGEELEDALEQIHDIESQIFVQSLPIVNFDKINFFPTVIPELLDYLNKTYRGHFQNLRSLKHDKLTQENTKKIKIYSEFHDNKISLKSYIVFLISFIILYDPPVDGRHDHIYNNILKPIRELGKTLGFENKRSRVLQMDMDQNPKEKEILVKFLKDFPYEFNNNIYTDINLFIFRVYSFVNILTTNNNKARNELYVLMFAQMEHMILSRPNTINVFFAPEYIFDIMKSFKKKSTSFFNIKEYDEGEE